MEVRRKTKYIYEIPACHITRLDGSTSGLPAVRIVVKPPDVIDNLTEFRASLEAIFAEIIKTCEERRPW